MLPEPSPAQPARPRTVLLAGAGDLCLRAGRILAAQGDTVWGLRRYPPSANPDAIHWIAADLTRPDTLASLPSGITHVVYAPSPDAREEAAYRRVFITGPQTLLERLDGRALQRFLFVSSSAVYGDHGDAWVDEDTPMQPVGFNGRILADAEQWLARRPDTVTLRLAGLYGPGRLQLLDRLKRGMARVPGDGRQWANRIHIDDAARAVAHVLGLQAPSPCYVAADDVPHRIGDFYDQIAAMIGGPPVPRESGKEGGGRRLRNTRLKASGFTLLWPDSIAGYQALASGPEAARGAS